MLIDLKQHDPAAEGWNGAADVCIVGAGPAGIMLARRLMGQGKKILLLESGGLDYESDTSQLNAGHSSGMPYYDLEDSRLRLFGGTAAIWGGRCAELDEIDFEARDWVPHSGWPFPKQALSRYYAEARRYLGLDHRPVDEQLWSDLGVDSSLFGDGVLDAALWRFDDRWERFGSKANVDLLHHPDVAVLLHASALSLELNESGNSVTGLSLGCLNGVRTRVRAKAFVLAAGGLENPRILLASRSVAPRGVGNDRDLVGRFFMEHPHARGGRLHIDHLWRFLRSFRSSISLEGNRYAACLRPDERLQRERGILNSSFTPRVRPHPQARMDLGSTIYRSLKHSVLPTQKVRTLWRAAKGAGRQFDQVSSPLMPWMKVSSGRRGLYLSVRAEQAPNPDSRVRIIENERDALGVPRIELDWRISEIDKRTVQVLVADLDQHLRRNGLGRVEAEQWLSDASVAWENDPLISQHPIGGYHHIGTTRMASDPRQGVVDANCRVHGLANLFVAGSSVFPTSGWANPTLTILALSARLGDHLEHEIGRMPISVAPPQRRREPALAIC